MNAGLHPVRAPDKVHASILELDRGYRALRRHETDSVEAGIERVLLVRRLGEIMRSLPTAQGRRDPNGAPSKSEALDALGISRQRAAEWEAVASLSEDELHAVVVAGRLAGEVTVAACLRCARRKRLASQGEAEPVLVSKELRRAFSSIETELRHLASAIATFDAEGLASYSQDSARKALVRIRDRASAALRGTSSQSVAALDIAEAAE